MDHILGPSLAYDAEHSSELVHTLEEFLRANRSWQRASEVLYVHKQTLVYRIKRVEELTGRRSTTRPTSPSLVRAAGARADDVASGRTSDAPVFVITGASSGIGAATARRPPRPATAWCSPPARKDKLDALAAETGGVAVGPT